MAGGVGGAFIGDSQYRPKATFENKQSLTSDSLHSLPVQSYGLKYVYVPFYNAL